MNNKVKSLKLQLTTAFFSLVVLLVSGFFILGPDLIETAKALSSNYSKAPVGGQLTVSDWNNLPADFVARTGGASSAMQGALDMGNNLVTNLAAPIAPNDAATRQYVLDNVGSGIENTNGDQLRMVCGKTPAGASGWYDNGGQYTVRIDIDTSSAGFTNDNVIYFASLGGDTQHYNTYGANSIYRADRNSFDMYAIYNGLFKETFNASVARNDYRWFVNWCGIGN